jgi:hypothetical protein
VGVVGVAFAPGAPVLVPEVAVGAAAELAELRDACVRAVRAVTELRPDIVLVVGTGEGSDSRSFPDSSSGSFAGIGVDLTVTLGREPSVGVPQLPLPLTIGAWLVQRAGWSGAGEALALGTESDAVGAGKELRDSTTDVGLVVVGDGSARLTTASPGYVHPEALQWQRDVDAAFARGDARYLLDLDAARAAELMVSGYGPWQLAAASVGDATLSVPVWRTEDTYGVGYVAAAWIVA